MEPGTTNLALTRDNTVENEGEESSYDSSKKLGIIPATIFLYEVGRSRHLFHARAPSGAKSGLDIWTLLADR